jgi:hypothetical protein
MSAISVERDGASTLLAGQTLSPRAADMTDNDELLDVDADGIASIGFTDHTPQHVCGSVKGSRALTGALWCAYVSNNAHATTPSCILMVKHYSLRFWSQYFSRCVPVIGVYHNNSRDIRFSVDEQTPNTRPQKSVYALFG